MIEEEAEKVITMEYACMSRGDGAYTSVHTVMVSSPQSMGVLVHSGHNRLQLMTCDHVTKVKYPRQTLCIAYYNNSTYLPVSVDSIKLC